MLLKSLLNEVSKKNVEKWSDESQTGNFYEKKRKIRHILTILSGNDLVEMIKDILTESEIEEISHKHVKALKNIGHVYSSDSNLSPLVRRTILRQIRSAGITFKSAKSLNFKCTKFLWQICLVKDYKRRGNFFVFITLFYVK